MDILIWPTTIFILIIIFLIIFRKEIADFIKEISWLKTKWFELKRIREEIFVKVEEVKKLSEELDKDKKELKKATKIFIESFYLTLQTRNIFPIPEKVAKEIEKNLNELSNFAIEDIDDRTTWIKEMQDLLNKK